MVASSREEIGITRVFTLVNIRELVRSSESASLVE